MVNWVEKEMHENALEAVGQGNPRIVPKPRTPKQEIEHSVEEEMQRTLEKKVDTEEDGNVLRGHTYDLLARQKEMYERLRLHGCGAGYQDIIDEYIIEY